VVETLSRARSCKITYPKINPFTLTFAGEQASGKPILWKDWFERRLMPAGRSGALLAPYGEQSRVTLRSEAERVNRPDVAEAFRDANTVARKIFPEAKLTGDPRASEVG
jgi:hypothetical protein